jgi:hypothetical protein
MIFKETSAKTGTGVKELFMSIADKIVRLSYDVPEKVV